MTTERYTLSYNPIFSLPIRMPGIALSISCSLPTFQLSLRGGCDESCIFEMNQTKNVWKITPMNFALGRLAYDIIWEDGLFLDEIVQLRILYAAVLKTGKDTQSQSQTIESRQWSIDFNPRRWLMLPKSRRQLSKIRVALCPSHSSITEYGNAETPQLLPDLTIPIESESTSAGPIMHELNPTSAGPIMHELESASTGPIIHESNSTSAGPIIHELKTTSAGPIIHELKTTPAGSRHELESASAGPIIHELKTTPAPSTTVIQSSISQKQQIQTTPEYKLAIATIPLKIIDCLSTNGILDLSLVINSSIIDQKLNFSQIFGAWLVFDQPVDWEKYSVRVTYDTET